MPAHIYMRVGRYDLAVEHNQHAVTQDLSFIHRRHPAGVYPLIYTTHNYHFLSAALTMQGKGDEAVTAARAAAKQVPFEVMRQITPLEYFAPVLYTVLARFERWDEILQQSEPPAELPYTSGFYHYARGLALVGTRRLADARAQRDALATIHDAMPPDAMANLNSMKSLLGIALGHLDAELALGDALLAAGRPKEAEEAFREDLKRNRENGWALRGLRRALEKQGKQSHERQTTEA
jgi:tetratricopeptide (TPR) repeat protein